MSIVKFVVDHYSDIAILIAAAMSLIIMIKKGETRILKQILFSLVTEAEQLYGDGTGSLKYAAVADWIYQRIPSTIKVLFTAKDIEKMIEDVLDEAKEKWAKNSNLKTYIQSPSTTPKV